MENARRTGRDCRSRILGVDASAGSFAADQAHAFVADEVIESPDRIRATANASHHDIRQLAFRLGHLSFCLFPDDFLEIADHGREWMRPHDRADAVMRLFER